MKQILIFLTAFVLTVSSLFAYSGGSGTEVAPWQIADTDDLIELSNNPDDWSDYFILTADIVFDANEQNVDWDGDGTGNWDAEDQLGFSPIGNSTNYFEGEFDGDGHEIRNLFINRPSRSYCGFFGRCDEAVIENLTLTDVDIVGGNVTAGLAGHIRNNSEIIDCSVTGEVDGGEYVGGLSSYSESSTLTGSSSAVSVTASQQYCGGFAGNCVQCDVSECYSTGDVVGAANVGGFCGSFFQSTVEDSYSTSAVQASGNYSGGFVGQSSETEIDRSYSIGTVTGKDYSGGFIGFATNSTSLSQCYSKGSVDCTSNGGGFVGILCQTSIRESYSTGDVTRSSGTETSLGAFCGTSQPATIEKCYSIGDVDCGGATDKGFVGSESDSPTYANNFFDSDASNQSTATGATAKTTEEMGQVSTFTAAGWDFAGETANGTDDYWDFDPTGSINNEYPHLAWQDPTVYLLAPENGDGSSGDPYQISNLYNLFWLSKYDSEWSYKNFVQTADIDAASTSTWHGGAGFSPIGNDETKFTGEYDGDGHEIDGFFINNSSNERGLIGYGNGCTIKNLGMTNCNIANIGSGGTIAGWIENSSLVDNCYSSGSVAGDQVVGGLVGKCMDNSEIINSYSSCSVSSSTIGAGGLVCTVDGNSRVFDSYSTGDVDGEASIGGFVAGCNDGSFIERCYSSGNVSASGEYAGGFVGMNVESVIETCYSLGDVTRTSGTETNFAAFCAFIEDGYIRKCYTTGSVDCGGAADKGFVAEESGTPGYSANYFDSDVSNQTSATGGNGKTTSEMRDLYTFITHTWDFAGSTANGTNDYWDFDKTETINDGYPVLHWQLDSPNLLAPAAGDGSELNPYQISEVNNLFWLSRYLSNWDENYVQTTDIDASETHTWYGGAGFSPIGNSTIAFDGGYDGAGYEIDGLYINRPTENNVGFFGVIDEGNVHDLGVANADVTGGSAVGILIGDSEKSVVSSVWVTGSVSGNSMVGGLSGLGYTNSEISDSYADAEVRGNGIVGGFVGSLRLGTTCSSCYSLSSVEAEAFAGGFAGTMESYSIVDNSYSKGNVTRSSPGNNDFGGFCGEVSNSEIEYCYSTGEVTCGQRTDLGFAPIDPMYAIGNFFDSETSGQTSSPGATAKTTLEMNNYYMYFDADWDFMDESDNGNDDYWGQNSSYNDGYPFLSWQGYPNDPIFYPTVSTTTQPLNKSSNSAEIGLEIVDDGGDDCSPVGILLWNYDDSDKTIDDVDDVTCFSEETAGAFATGATSSETFTGLGANLHFNARAYTINTAGYGYGDRIDFWTDAITPGAPTISNIFPNSVVVDVQSAGNPASVEFAIGVEEAVGVADLRYLQANGTLGSTKVWRTDAEWGQIEVTGLSAETEYEFNAIARNGAGEETSPGEETNDFTLSVEPSAQASVFRASPGSNGGIFYNFTAADQILDCDGYFLIMRECEEPIDLPSDGNGYSVGETFGVSTVAAIITNTSRTNMELTSGISSGVTYQFKLAPFNWDGENEGTYNYKTSPNLPKAVGNTDSEIASEVDDVIVPDGITRRFSCDYFMDVAPEDPVEVLSGGSLFLTAGSSIRFLPGFSAEAGSSVSTELEGDPPCSGTRLIDRELLANTFSDETLDMSIFPNPNHGKFTIELNRPAEEPTTVEISNALGKTRFYEFGFGSSFVLDITDLSRGVYLITVRTGSEALRGVIIYE